MAPNPKAQEEMRKWKVTITDRKGTGVLATVSIEAVNAKAAQRAVIQSLLKGIPHVEEERKTLSARLK